MITARIEDYLEEIFLLESTGRDITVTGLAERLSITKGTVTSTVQKMVDAGMLNHERYGTLHLTREGRSNGLLIYHRHEGLRAFFHEFLGLDRERSSDMACGMEHYMDTVTGERLYAMLEFFRRAKADKEPWVDELLRAMNHTQVTLPNPLSVFENEQKGVVVRLSAEDSLRQRLQDTGFTAGAVVTCVDSVSDDSVLTALGGREILLSRNEAATIWLRMISE